MSKNKYPSIFLPQMEAIVFITLQIFFVTHTVLKIREYSWIFPSFGWGTFGHVTHLDQSHTSKKIWWIINSGGTDPQNFISGLFNMLCLINLNLIMILNRPFYSCVLSYLAMNASEAGGDLALIRTSLLFICKWQLVSIRTTWFAQ